MIIDNWFEQKWYNSILEEMQEIKNPEPELKFDDGIQKKKVAHSANSNLGQLLKPFVDRLTGRDTLDLIRSITKIDQIIPLTMLPVEQTQYKYYHQMFDGGKLGSHVDHSKLYDRRGKIVDDDMVHFANAIFYVDIEMNYSGATEFFGPFGLGESKKRIKPLNNRLLLFQHTSSSFHGVDTYKSPNKKPRTTIYMDYYTHKKNLDPSKYWTHRTTFVPKNWMTMHKYLPWYLVWLLRRKL
jgi:hypothetical protein